MLLLYPVSWTSFMEAYAFLIIKRYKKISICIFKVTKILDPDLDPDPVPDSMNPDPQLWII
jgi:hypothetical protein